MASPEGIAIGVLFIAMGAPFIMVPKKIAKARYRYATNPEPTKEGIHEVRLAGAIFIVAGLFVFSLAI